MAAGGIPEDYFSNLSKITFQRHPLQSQTRNLSGLRKFASQKTKLPEVGQKRLLDSLEQLAQSKNIIMKKFD